jgi:hypothetical protein
MAAPRWRRPCGHALRRIRFDSEPGANLWKRFKARVLSWLPIEGLL